MLELALLLAVLSPQSPQADPTPDSAQEALPPEPTLPRVVIETTMGSITVQLFPEDSPLAVENFLAYVRSGHYEGTLFHRVIPDFMIQGGGYDAEMKERETRGPIKNEARNGLRNERGTLAMARTRKAHSARAQFYVNLKMNHRLDFGIGGAGYTVFGEVIEGMAVVDQISRASTSALGEHGNAPNDPIFIVKTTEVVEEAEPEPEPPKP